MKTSQGHIILADHRERKILNFPHPEIQAVRKCHLPVGDYCVVFSDGFQPAVVFERKSVGDLFGTLLGGYEKFKREINRAETAGVQLIIVVEGTYTKISKGLTRVNFRNPRGPKIHWSGIRIIRTLFSLWSRYGVVSVFCKDREEMQDFIVEFYLAIWRKRRERKVAKRRVIILRKRK
jgi:ERCC4-type nuclease